MTEQQFRTVLWESLFLADYQVRYWHRYVGRIRRFTVPIKMILFVSGILSLVGLLLLEKYRFSAAVVGTIAAFIATVIVPVFGWDAIEERVLGLHNDWVNVRNGYRSVWNELGDVDQTLLEKQYALWNARDVELEQRSIRLPRVDEFREQAFAETQQQLIG